VTTNGVEPLRILVTGWRYWPGSHSYVIGEALSAVRAGVLPSARAPEDPTATLAFVARPDWRQRPVIVRHGMCPYGGADLWADRWAVQYGHLVDRHPADRFGANMRMAGPLRNSWMVEYGPKPDLCLAFPGPNSSGTWDCVHKAARRGIETVVTGFHWPVEEEWLRGRPIQWPPSNMEELKL
jgi:hypothetical protein